MVDDNLTSRTLLGHLLTNWKVAYSLVDSGKEALASLYAAATTDQPYSIAIIDMQMPEMNGLALGAIIKNDKKLSNTLLVMLTSQEQPDGAEKSKTLGFDGYLSKPIDQSILYNTLLQVAGSSTIITDESIDDSAPPLPQFEARILVVEDNVINQMVARLMLEQLGINVDLAINGEEALQALATLSYDLVFMDCQMPIMDGFEATRKIRDPQSTARDKTIPIIAMTANTMKGDREKCLAAGMDDFITKPVEPDRLQQVLQHWLSKQGSEQTDDKLGDLAPAYSEPLFDYAAMSDRLMNNEALIHTVVLAFMDDTSKQIEQLKTSIKEQDLPTIIAKSHNIKGAAANVGGMTLSALAHTMEQAAKAGEMGTVTQTLPQLEQCFSLLKTAMAQFL